MRRVFERVERRTRPPRPAGSSREEHVRLTQVSRWLRSCQRCAKRRVSDPAPGPKEQGRRTAENRGADEGGALGENINLLERS